MRAAGNLLILAFITITSACTAVGVVSSSDPLTKLNDAQVLMLKNRPVPAEQLIQEALAIYQREADAHGLGMTYREYADFLESAAVRNWEQQYRRNGFLDGSITFDNRLSKASEFYRTALEHLKQAAQERESSGRYDALTNVYFNMAWAHLALDEKDRACEDLDHTSMAYAENIRRHPDAKPVTSGAYGTLPEDLAFRRRQAGC